MNLLITCPPGLAQVCKQELKHLGYNGQVITPTSLLVQDTSPKDMITLNLRLRTANKVFIILDKRQIGTFDELFDFVAEQERSERVQNQQPILIEASSYKSQLTSLPAIQSIVKKSLTIKLTGDREIPRVENKGIEEFAVTIMLHSDTALILLNTSGESLHRRGYRTETGEAPLKETIAAGLILDTGRRFHTPFYDICCGSGTICIEAALIAKNIAPGLLRTFAFQSRKGYKSTLFEEVKAEAKAKQIDKPHTIIGSDLDPEVIAKAKANAKSAGLADDAIIFEVKDCKQYISPLGRRGGEAGEVMSSNSTLISNPPYGQRMQADDISEIHTLLFGLFDKHNLTGGIFTGYPITPSIARHREQKRLKNGAEDVIFWKKKS